MVPAYFCQCYNTRYQSAVTKLDQLESNIKDFNERLAKLEAHKSSELTQILLRGLISTSDRPLDEHFKQYGPLEKHLDNFFEAINAKGGPLILPELRLASGSATNCEYNIEIDSQLGIVAHAWLSHAEPYQDLAAFDEFRVFSPNKTNVVKLIVRPKPGASVQMRFEVVVLC